MIMTRLFISSAKYAAILPVNVVLPTPPLLLKNDRTIITNYLVLAMYPRKEHRLTADRIGQWMALTIGSK